MPIAGTQAYQITHRETGRTYFGAGDAKTRLQSHFGGRSCNEHLGRAIAKYGRDAFDVGCVECLTPENAAAVEFALIDLMGGPDSPLLFNMKEGGGSKARFSKGTRRKMSERQKSPGPERRKYLSELSKARWDDAEYRERHSARLKRQWKDPAYRAKMAKSCRGKPKSAEARARMSASRKKLWEDPAYRAKAVDSIQGLPRVEQRKRLSSRNRLMKIRGVKLSEETRRKISEAQKGHSVSAETRAKMSAALKGRKRTPEHCANLSKARRAHAAKLRAWKSACGVHWVMRWRA